MNERCDGNRNIFHAVVNMCTPTSNKESDNGKFFDAILLLTLNFIALNVTYQHVHNKANNIKLCNTTIKDNALFINQKLPKDMM